MFFHALGGLIVLAWRALVRAVVGPKQQRSQRDNQDDLQ